MLHISSTAKSRAKQVLYRKKLSEHSYSCAWITLCYFSYISLIRESGFFSQPCSQGNNGGIILYVFHWVWITGIKEITRRIVSNVKGVWHEIFYFKFFSWISSPGPPGYSNRTVYIFFRKFADIFANECISAVSATAAIWQINVEG